MAHPVPDPEKFPRFYIHTKGGDATTRNGCVVFRKKMIFSYTFSDEDGRHSLILLDFFDYNCYELVAFGFDDIADIAATDNAIFFVLKKNPNVLNGAKYVIFNMFLRALLIFDHGAFRLEARYVSIKNKQLKHFSRQLLRTYSSFYQTGFCHVDSNNEGYFATAYCFYIFERHPEDPSSTNVFIMDSKFSTLIPPSTTVDFVIAKVVTGQNHVVLLDDEDRLFVHGFGLHGELGLGATNLRADKNFVWNEMIAEQIPDGIVKMAACKHFNAVLSRNGDVFIWGWNRTYGNLPGLDRSVYFDPVPLDFQESVININLTPSKFTVVFENEAIIFSRATVHRLSNANLLDTEF